MKKGWIMLLLGVGLALSLGWGFNQYTELHKARQTIAGYQDVEALNQRSEDFARAYAQGKHQEFLTKAAVQRFAQQDNREKDHEDVHMTDDTGLKNVEIKQLYTKKLKDRDDQAESYATVRLQYEMGGSNSPVDDYIQTFSIHSVWIKEDGEWKANDVDISLTGDTSDDELRRQAKEALENATKARDGE
ncbi:hypothetical protein IAQ67_29365 (plasmid) [Paenibacillus peoriae]|uniref:Uncharacterized protein n=1 Tax=Paenibacillus peoriae TaxID=59893 RepID=A0A7H0YHH1_9BACL|nr:hypothetical protein [Paenibacillus peoriae]QNR70529.1 hypothetical protein IAQ67_29365 [Paenibacillus peoriae]